MPSRLQFLWRRYRETLWLRPLGFCTAAMLAALSASWIGAHVPAVPGLEIDPDTVEKLLSIIASSMLGVATFAVASMVSAYASAGGTATPRVFPLVIADDASKTALSSFVAAFIYSVIALVAIKTGYYTPSGRLILFLMTVGILAWVLLSFIRWTDNIARLGRLGTVIDRVEAAARDALERRRAAPHLGGKPADPGAKPVGRPVAAVRIGYVQHIDVGGLQRCAEAHDLRFTVSALPGTFMTPGRALGYAVAGGEVEPGDPGDDVDAELGAAFTIGDDRVFEEDPRFGLIALSEIAARALSPAVNDPGTAIDIIGTAVRLLAGFVAPGTQEDGDIEFDRVFVPALGMDDLFDDAFTAIARDGAGTIEVMVRLQKALTALHGLDHRAMADAACRHSRLALARAEAKLALPDEIEVLRGLALAARAASVPAGD
ncbi:MAG: DUF2254 domain-containing protein [Hyphomicrobiaceae bacterium]